MNKITLSIIVACLITISSCKKDNISGANGSWTINSTTYQATDFYDNVLGSPGMIVVGNSVGASSPSSICDLNLIFYDTLPSSPNTYTVINEKDTLNAPNQIQISTQLNGSAGPFYYSSGSGSNQTVSVTISNGKMNISGSGINMFSTSGNTTLSFNVHQ